MFSTTERQRMYQTAIRQARQLDVDALDRILRDVLTGTKRDASVDEDGICAHCLDPESQPVTRDHSTGHHLACDACGHDWHPVHNSARRRM